MKKIMLFMVGLFLVMSSGFSATIQNSISDDIFDDISNYIPITLDTTTIQSNSLYEVSKLKHYYFDTLTQYYVYNDNSNLNINFTLQVEYVDETGVTHTTTNDIIIGDDEFEVFLVKPTRNLEPIKVSIICVNADINCGDGYRIYEKIYTNTDSGLGSTFSPLINAVVELVTINVAIWKILYYVFIGSIVLGLVGGIIALGFKYYKWADSHSMWKRKSNHVRK